MKLTPASHKKISDLASRYLVHKRVDCSVDKHGANPPADSARKIAQAKERMGADLAQELTVIEGDPDSYGHDNFHCKITVIKDPYKFLAELTALLEKL